MSNALKIGLIFVAFVVIIIGITAFSWAMGWILKPAEIFSVQNVEQQWEFAYDTEEDLLAVARNICFAQDALDAAETDWERQQRQTQLTAHLNNYARVTSDFDARLRDAFRAGWVKPPDVREEALTIKDAIAFLVLTEDLDCTYGD
ncbi:MAG: hypothetical protein ACYSW3_01900 [Planctomycetota bacterium]|jgi:hypothetical protein